MGDVTSTNKGIEDEGGMRKEFSIPSLTHSVTQEVSETDVSRTTKYLGLMRVRYELLHGTSAPAALKLQLSFTYPGQCGN